MKSISYHVKLIIKIIAFFAIGFLFLAISNFIAQPFWITSFNNTYDTVTGFYNEPKDTIETVFLGSSHVRYGISPMDLYESYGICAYDLSTDTQPILASYFWLEETYRLHSETLDTIVLDMSMIRRDPDSAAYHKAVDPMKLSYTKLRAVKAYSEDFEDFLQNIFPLTSYHERWKELTSTDFLKYEYEPEISIRGYQYNASQWINSVSDFSEISTPLIVDDKNEVNTSLDDTAIIYFEKMVDFCKEHDLQLVLIKTPTTWTSEDHNEVQMLADTYGLEFIDFNVDPYYSEVKFNFATDLIIPTTGDNYHANYYGAKEITDFLGQYLIEECGNRDVRGDEKYAFMEDELVDYNQYVTFRQSLSNATDPCDYIETALDDGDYTIFISVKDDAASSLTEEQRKYFESIGLTELSELTYGCSYLAVIDNGNVITEQYQKDPGEENENDDLVSYSGTLHNGTAYTVISGGYHMGNQSSIIIEETERSVNKRGLNIAIYDNEMQRYVTNANFDTWLAPEREAPFSEQSYEALMEEETSASILTGTDRIMYLYKRECENEKTAKLARLEMNEEDGLITYLKAFWDDEDIDIYITVQGDVSNVLNDTERVSLSELGLTELSQLSGQDSYVAAICGGIIAEERDSIAEPIELTSDKYAITYKESRGGSDEHPSVVTNGTEYSQEKDGIFIVIYDNITEMAVDTITFEPDVDDSEVIGEAAG